MSGRGGVVCVCASRRSPGNRFSKPIPPSSFFCVILAELKPEIKKSTSDKKQNGILH